MTSFASNKNNFTLKIFQVLSVAAIAIDLISCGGGSSGGDSSNSLKQTTTVIGTSGGSATSSDSGTTIQIPAGALFADTAITITPDISNPPPGVGKVLVDLGPDGTTFNVPVTLRMKYDPASIPPGINEANLTLAFLSDSSWTDIPTTVDTVNKLLIGQITHFSKWGQEPLTTSPGLKWNSNSGCLTTTDANYNNSNAQLAQRVFNLSSPPSTGTGCITEPYLADNYSYWIPSLQNHAGVDFRAVSNTPAYALYDGTVVNETLDIPNKHSTLVIQSIVNGQTLDIYYLHCQSHDQIRNGVNMGRLSYTDTNHNNVLAGDQVCQTGSVGAAAPHLHMEVKKLGMDNNNLSAMFGSHCPSSNFLNYKGVQTKGCTIADIQANTINPVDLVFPVLISAFTVSHSGLQANFDASTSTPSANITNYSWDFGDGSSATGVTASHAFTSYGTWLVTLNVNDSFGRNSSISKNVSATCPTGQVIVNGQCVTPLSYSIGGTVNGLASGNYIVLQNNSGETLSVAANGPFTFTTPLNDSSAYNVTIFTLPTGQPCTTTNGAGTVNGANVTNINVVCGPAFVGAFSAAGSMTTARFDHTATLLANGKVLVAGGANYNTGTFWNTELYDPATNTWSVASNMTTPREWHTATLLPNGKVLVVGGWAGTSLASVELYDPATNSWSAAGSLVKDRYHHSATLLPSGKVLVAGGYSESSPGATPTEVASAELYDPETNTWSSAGNLTTGAVGHTATLLPNGKVLVAGGLLNTYLQYSSELYDPATNTWSGGGYMTTARYGHTATLLPNGKVLVAGCGWNTGVCANAELYDPMTNTWSATASLATGRYLHTATLLPNGKVLVAGGLDNTSSLASAELYDPTSNTWSAASSMTAPRSDHTATLLPNGKVLISGGDSFITNNGVLSGSALNSAELFW
jgi:N-acetylneuraminic acid mutarotase